MIHNDFFRVLGQKNKIHKFWLIGYNSVQTIEKAALYNVLKGSFITSKLKSMIKTSAKERLSFPLMNTRINDNCKITN